MLNDRVSLIKTNGRRFDNLPASVQSGKIFTDDPQIPIEDGDWFERRTPSGVVERFRVIDAGFEQELHGIGAHYQSKVQKETVASTSRPSRVAPGEPVQAVFLVHGHDEAARESVARYLDRLGVKPIILHEQAS